MSTQRTHRIFRRPDGRRFARPDLKDLRERRQSQEGFTLVELLIVVTILPMIIGALSIGLISVLSLQSSVSDRLSDTSDSQVVMASYENDIQGAAEVTTAASSTPQCGVGTGTQLLGLEFDLNQTTGTYSTLVSYVSVPVGATSTSLERLICSQSAAGVVSSPTSVTTLSYDLPASQSVPQIKCVSSASSSACSQSLASQQYISTQNISEVTLQITEPNSNDTYTLVGSPEAATSSTNTGSPFTANTDTSCEFASPNTGTYASTLCFVDFSYLTGAALAQATGGGCLETSVTLPGNYVMYFCISISGPTILPWYLPTYPEAFLGNSNNGVPFYTGTSGDPALYQRVEGSTDTVTLSDISVVAPSGSLATGWEAVSADAESTDVGESITWNSNVDLTDIPNGQSVDTPSDPVGNACQNGAGLTGAGTTQMECSGGTTETSATKTGTAMIAAIAPNTFSATLVGTGLQGVTFGLLVS
jgi:prepilin-type N-terminal cleavage/methylation domain-containing protein